MISFAAYQILLGLQCPTTTVLCAHYPQKYLFASGLVARRFSPLLVPECRRPSGSEHTMDVVLKNGGLVDCWEIAVQGNISLRARISSLARLSCPASQGAVK